MGALVLRDNSDYDLSKGEMSPAIFEEFVGEVLERKIPTVIWEPFAGHTGQSKTQDFAEDIDGLELVSFDLEPSDSRVRKADSMKTGPGKEIGGMLFHPSYYGSMFASNPNEVGFATNKDEYVKRIGKVASLAIERMAMGGLVCAVGRDYRYAGRRIRMDLWYLDIFERLGMTLKNVWMSEPDVAMIFEKGE
jgi:hypothetical protein